MHPVLQSGLFFQEWDENNLEENVKSKESVREKSQQREFHIGIASAHKDGLLCGLALADFLPASRG